MKLKRDVVSNNAPANDQVEVGELVINAKTGILYSKMVDGTIIKFLGTPVCANDLYESTVPVPVISFSDVTNFCCGGDTLTVYVSNLLVDHSYFCTITDLIENSTVVVSPSSLSLSPNNISDRSVIFNINADRANQNLAMLKVSIYEIVNNNNTTLNMLLSEKVINICCRNCVS